MAPPNMTLRRWLPLAYTFLSGACPSMPAPSSGFARKLGGEDVAEIGAAKIEDGSDAHSRSLP